MALNRPGAISPLGGNVQDSALPVMPDNRPTDVLSRCPSIGDVWQQDDGEPQPLRLMNGHDVDGLMVAVETTGVIVPRSSLLIAYPSGSCRRRQSGLDSRGMGLLSDLAEVGDVSLAPAHAD